MKAIHKVLKGDNIPSPWFQMTGSPAVDEWNVFTQEQILSLLQNGQEENHGKNHVPVAYLRVRNLGYRFLITEIDPQTPEKAYGLCDYDTDMKIDFVNLKDLAVIAKQNGESILARNDFEGKYPLAVYDMVASNVGSIITDDTVSGYGEYFSQFAKGPNVDPSVYLGDLPFYSRPS